MASLADHLRQPESHGRLPFHSGCPVCRAERISGRAAGDALLGHRGQAGLLATTLAVSSLALPSGVLAESDRATAQTAQTPDGDLDRVDGDDGAQADTPAAEDDTVLRGENLIEPEPDDGREGPEPTPLSELSPEQSSEETEPLVESAPETQTPPAVPDVAPTPTTPTPSPPVAPSPVAPLPAVGALEDRGVGEAALPTVRHRRLNLDRAPSTIPVERTTAAPATDAAASQPEVEAAVPNAPASMTNLQTGARVTPVRNPGPARPITGDTYTVRRGDSLWSIARRVRGAEASVGAIAGEVNRLWELNRDRIATGNPSLLHIGTELEL